MDWIEVLVGTVVAYLIGSIPFGILIGKLYYGIDIREHGSGVATHLNIQRVMGWKAGVLTRVLDTAKGFLAASIAYIIHRKYGLYDAYEIPMMQMTFGLAAVMGHIFPVFAQFR
ncbi:MAG: glycerol-3-phosphate acyltransferase, partial [Bacteroidota bacterium]